MSMGRSKNSLPEQETSRLDAVLEEAWTKINIISRIHRESIHTIKNLDDETAAIISEMLVSEDNLQRLAHSRGASSHAIEELATRLRQNIRDVCRRISATEECLASLNSSEETQAEITLFGNLLNDLRKLVLHKLSSSEQEKSRAEISADLEIRINSLDNEKADKSLQLQKVKKNKEKDLIFYNGIINKLREEINHEIQAASLIRSKIQSEEKEERDLNSIAFNEMKKSYEDQIWKLKSSIPLDRIAHLDDERKKADKKGREEKALNDKISDFDQKMLSLFKEYDALELIHQDELRQLNVLREHFRVIDRNLEIIAAEEAEIERIRKDKLKKANEENDAAIVIQRNFKKFQFKRDKKGAKDKKAGAKSKAPAAPATKGKKK